MWSFFSQEFPTEACRTRRWSQGFDSRIEEEIGLESEFSRLDFTPKTNRSPFIPFQQEESARRHVTNLEEIRRKAMEMRTLRGPSAEDHQHGSPGPDDSRITTSMTSIMTPDDAVITRKCCTLCNLLVSFS